MQKNCKLLGMLLVIVMTVSAFSALVSADEKDDVIRGQTDFYAYTITRSTSTLEIKWTKSGGAYLGFMAIVEDLQDVNCFADVKYVVIDLTEYTDQSTNMYIDGTLCYPDRLEITYCKDNDQIKRSYDMITVAGFHKLKGDDIFFKEGTKIRKLVLNEMHDLKDLSFISAYGVEETKLTIFCPTIKIPSGVKQFDDGAFYNCYMQSVYIPQSVEKINSNAFDGCSRLKDVFFEGTKEQWETACGNSNPEDLANVNIHYDYKPGWYQYDDGSWSYVKNDLDETVGWKLVADAWYYFDGNGKMQTGWQKISGSWYFFESSGGMAYGWKKVGGTWYYMNECGIMVTGWQQIGGVWYFFKPSGAMAENEYCGGYWLNAGGAWTYEYKASWKQDSKGWWYGDDSG